MNLKMPESMEECFYFTNREIEGGHVVAWVFKKQCPKCKKALMGKPVDKGKVKVRAKYYECPNCGYQEDKDEYENSLVANIKYTCPYCGNESEQQIPFKRKKVKGVETLRFKCEKCNKDIDITKKMKEKKA
jgi:DNA-directed RNA polymerase subunit M/transcription elongation factor TFIIS